MFSVGVLECIQRLTAKRLILSLLLVSLSEYSGSEFWNASGFLYQLIYLLFLCVFVFITSFNTLSNRFRVDIGDVGYTAYLNVFLFFLAVLTLPTVRPALSAPSLVISIVFVDTD